MIDATQNEVYDNAKKIKRTIELKRKLFVLSFCIVPIVNFLIFYVYVNADAIVSSFKIFEDGQVRWGLDHYLMFIKELGNEVIFSEAFRNTFLSFLVMLALFPVGIIIAYLFYKKIFMCNIIRTLFFLPSLLSSTVVTSVFMKIIGVSGPIAPLVSKLLGLDYVPTLIADSRFANWVIFAQMIWLGIPGDMIIWGGALSRIPNSVIEAGELDGVGWWTELWQIIVPMIWPTFSMKILLSFCGIFGATGNVFLLTKGNYGTMTLSCWMYLQVYNLNGDVESNTINYMSAVGMIITILSMIIVFVVRKATKKLEEVQY